MVPESFAQLRQDNADRSAYRRTWNLCMTSDDVAAFSDALKAAFPSIRFLSREYNRQFKVGFEAGRRENERRVNLGLPLKSFRTRWRDPTGEPLRYSESLADPAETRFIAWIEPPGWQPVWALPDNFGERYIENTPRLWFDFYRCDYLLLGRPHVIPHRRATEPQPRNGRAAIALEGHSFEVRWNPSEPEAEAFAKTVYNILRKLTVDRFIRVERESRRAFALEAQGMRKQCLAGRHAVAWTMKRRHNYLSCDNDGWAMLKPANYPFRRRDVFTKAEYRRWRAKLDKDFEERLRLHKEAYERFRGMDGGGFDFESRGGKLIAARLYESWEAHDARRATALDTRRRVVLELKLVRRRGRAQWREVRAAPS